MSTNVKPKRPADATDSDEGGESNHGRKIRPKTILEAHKAQLDRLMNRVDKDIVLPNRPSDKPRAPRKEAAHIVRNIQGSSAGAGSGEFHVYRALRRKENTRLKALDDAAQREEDRQEYEKRQLDLRTKEAEKTNKNREKRLKRKKGNAKPKPVVVGPAPAPNTTMDDDQSNSV
ncbi:hypothetical protein BASA50_005493 [Batrachochytrium salamandrivorans]|uniref:PRKR-interacting protein 1 n=1 Tax=Batrachochytrium salamandrivorans TaxID=1357716 RepID=A0ABQ8FCX4_9FUNG|nr:hypothetical protein BASA60_005052 [Batrachochytrium salamandrivorans]KAH6577729.1 hypothetical protein BASA62_000710 [Batrachochytrium salamandrivorans]KAH6584874.1 hypothetical protein BASA61_007242 [Batrachochytrium salamandrivorans]KAH6595913.1 hypothetical protein BASA50_005493 [Batrachochytrium salamandrivorans]KAH9249276.1 hypothetical protein BASA81_013003 [Batrachochytrium salamandrivorans]